MPTRIDVPGPDFKEESRQLAEAVADLHYVMSLLVENATQLMPGETVNELAMAWDESQASMEELVETLMHLSSTGQPLSLDRPTTDVTLTESQLTGAVGKVKMSTLRTLKDSFLMWWNAEPRTDEKRVKASEAASDYLEYGASVVSSIPGFEQVVEVLSLGRQLLGIRAKRGM